MKKNVIVAVFSVESEGFQALSELRQTAGGETYLVSAAALVKKEKNNCIYLDGFDTGLDTRDDAAKGGLIGMTIGILGGPLGVILGASYGSLIGMTADAGDEVLGVSMLDQIADKLDDGMVALVALAEEESEFALDAKLSAYDTIIARFDAEVVADEVDKVYEKQAEMARLAKMEVERKQAEKFKADVKESVEQGIEKFKSDMEFTANAIKEAGAEMEAEAKAQEAKDIAEFEENSEILRQGFTK